jgi:hypothetical protein
MDSIAWDPARYIEDPYPVYQRLRDEAPAYYTPARNCWTISRYDDIRALLMRDATLFRIRPQFFVDPVPEISISAMDPPQHDRMRKLVFDGFTLAAVHRLEPGIRELVNRCMDEFAEKGSCDIYADLAARVPCDVISAMVGLPVQDYRPVRELADRVIKAARPDHGLASLYDYFRSALRERRRAPAREDLMGQLMEAQIDGDRLSDEEIVDFCVLLIIAGNETTTDLITTAVHLLGERPEEWRRLVEDPSAIASAVEEVLRFDSPVQYALRKLRHDLDFLGCPMKEGQLVCLLYASGNRDPRRYPDPDRFDVRRRPAAILSFGRGIHVCLGAQLARLEARVLLAEMVRRIPEYELVPDGARRLKNYHMRGFLKLPIRFAPTAGR